jgi:hypothetical protein
VRTVNGIIFTILHTIYGIVDIDEVVYSKRRISEYRMSIVVQEEVLDFGTILDSRDCGVLQT